MIILILNKWAVFATLYQKEKEKKTLNHLRKRNDPVTFRKKYLFF